MMTTKKIYLLKRTCNLKQNGTHEKTPFSGIVLYALSSGVGRFVPTVCFSLEPSDRSFALADGSGFWNTRNKIDHTTCNGTKDARRKLCLFLALFV